MRPFDEEAFNTPFLTAFRTALGIEFGACV